MSLNRETAVRRARIEWEEDGVVHADTFIALTALGLDAEAIIESFNEETNG